VKFGSETATLKYGRTQLGMLSETALRRKNSSIVDLGLAAVT
jgi:hypothetical protein